MVDLISLNVKQSVLGYKTAVSNGTAQWAQTRLSEANDAVMMHGPRLRYVPKPSCSQVLRMEPKMQAQDDKAQDAPLTMSKPAVCCSTFPHPGPFRVSL